MYLVLVDAMDESLLTYVHRMKTELAHSRCRGMKKKSLQKSEEQILGISR